MDAVWLYGKDMWLYAKDKLPHAYSNVEFTPMILATCLVISIISIIILWVMLSKIKSNVLPRHEVGKPRFRKRDKVLFYGRKMLRNVSSKVNMMSGGKSNRVKKRQVVLKLAKKLLRMKKESQPQLRVKEPPQSFLEADGIDKKGDSRLPPEVLYMLRSVRVFGHFETPLFWDLCRYMETMSVGQGQYLFKVGEPDDSIFVIQSGCVDVFVTEADGIDYLMKKVCAGDSIHSLLSLLDVLTGHPAPYKTVSAKASSDSTVLRLPAVAFQELFTRYPESLVRVVQIITVRLQRVTFSALHNYLGLSSELIKPHNRISRALMIHQVSFKDGVFHPARSRLQPQPSSPELGTSKDTASIATSPIIADAQPVGPSDFDAACMRARVHSTSGVPQHASAEHKVEEDRRRGDLEAKETREVKTDEDILELARQDLLKILKLQDSTLLDGRLHLRRYKAGSTLVKQGDQDCNLYFVVSGRLRALQQLVGEGSKETHMFKVHPGEIVGTLAVLTGEQSFFSFQAKLDSIVVVISKTDFYKIMRKQPSVVLDVAHTIVQRMSPFTRQIDFALDWMMVEAGCALYRQGDKGDSTYIVLMGRLRSVITLIDGKKEMVGEYGRGEIVGIVESLTHTERATTVIAVRDTELAAIPTELVNLIKRKYPQVVTRLIHLLGQKILGNLQGRNGTGLSVDSEHLSVDGKPSVTNLATIAIVPISRDVPLTNFTLELKHALSPICQTAILNSEVVKIKLGVSALESVNEFRLYNWLGQMEDDNDMVIYQCDDTPTKWTLNCIRQADCILIVGLADCEPAVIGEIESKLESVAVRAQKELVLLHHESAVSPRHTVNWLNARGWVSRYHHIQCPARVFRVHPPSRVKATYQKLSETTPDRNSDFSRLARILTGTSIGLVLGGGGARGISHVGIIRALLEAGVPIDMVGGTSIGSLVGALWCDTRNVSTFSKRMKAYSVEMTSLWKKIFDLTYPITSMFSGAAFNHISEKTFKDRQIEDLWIPYFCVSTDITASKMRVHTNGSLWRYVRSSMSLAGYLPPLCDPVDGHLLLDGGYVNNLPADVMRAMGIGHIFAVDVGSRDDGDLTNYGDELSGWWLLWKRWNPWTTPVKVPDMNEIQSRLAYVSCERQLEIVRNSNWCEYIRPPIDKYRTLQFGSHDEIDQVGYDHGRTMLAAWSKGGLIDKLFQKRDIKPNPDKGSEFTFPPMANFTDLAEIVSKIESPPLRSNMDSYFGKHKVAMDSTTEEIDSELGDEDEEYEDEDDDEQVSSAASQTSLCNSTFPDNMPSCLANQEKGTEATN